MINRLMSGLTATLVLLVAGCPGPTDPPPQVGAPPTVPASTIGSIDGPADPLPTSTTLVCRITNGPACNAVVPDDPCAITGRCPRPSLPPANPAGLPAPSTASWPKWRTTADGVPYYSGRPACTVEQAQTIADEFADAGASIATRQWAIYVASREGGCNYQAYNGRGSDRSYCTFQLNALSGPLSPGGYLTRLGYTPDSVTASLAGCAEAAAALWHRCGKGPWIYGDYSCRWPDE